jgi:hypothetical protein
MRAILIAATAALLLAGAQSALAADATAVMKPINGFVAAANANKPMSAYVTASQSVIDEFPPHHWTGPSAVKTWWADLDALSKKQGISDVALTLSQPTRVEQGADHAYVVAPAVVTYKQKAKSVREDGSMTFALDHSKAGWKIAALSWNGGKVTP